MEIKPILSCVLLGTFLLISSLPSLSSSIQAHETFPVKKTGTTTTHDLTYKLSIKPVPYTTIQQFLLPHNAIRAKLGLPPLKWSKKLASFAASWAHQRQDDCALVHSNSDYGENLFWGSGRDWKPRDAVMGWAAERRYYNRGTNSCSPDKECLHYTQVIWKNSLRVGCAKAVCKTGDTFITCNYDPHGNVVGQMPY